MKPEQALEAIDASVTVALLVAADRRTGPATAWSLARMATMDRPVALIDLTFGEGALNPDADQTGPEGISDVFQFGASWSHVARPQRTPELHFIPTGTPPADPHAIWGHQRWEKLRRGFERQGALLMLYVPPRAIADLAPRAEAVIAVGHGPAVSTARAVAAGRGLTMVGPVELPGLDEPPPTFIAHEPPPEPAVGGSSRWIPWAVGGTMALLVFAAASVVLRRPADAPAGPAAPPAATVAPDPSPPPAAAAAPAAAVPLDSLFYGVQVAAFNQLGPARELADALATADRAVAIAPVRIGSGETLWYRVIVGAVETPGEAAAIRRGLWDTGRLERGRGTVLRVPHVWSLAVAGNDREAALEGLRQEGIPAYIVPGAPALYFGAFETPDQAAAAESLLAAVDRPRTLVARRGTR